MPSQRQNALISILFVIFGGPGIVLVYIPLWITRFHLPRNEPYWQILLASALILLGLVPLFESIVRFVRIGRGTLVPAAPPMHLVVNGLYRYVRNPMYVGVFTAIAGESILFANRGMIIYLAAIWLGMHLFVCFHEEPALARRFPEEYAEYKRHVPRWLPRPTPWQRSAE